MIMELGPGVFLLADWLNSYEHNRFQEIWEIQWSLS